MVLVSLLLTVVFGVVFAVRGVMHARRTGSSPLRGGAGVAGAAALAAWAVVVLAGPIGSGLGLTPWWRSDVLGAAGALVALAGIAVAVWSSVAMGQAWRIGVDPDETTELVVAGPFGLVRNPIYVAMMAFGVGVTLLVPNALSAGLCAAVVVALNLHVRLVEEPHLARHHRESYGRYAAQTGRFVPKLR